MKIASTIDSSIIGRIFLIFFIVSASYYVSLFVVDFSYQGIILLTVLCFGMMLLLLYPKVFIYFMIIFYPLMPLLWESTSMQLGESRSLGINLGGMLKVLGLVFGIVFLTVKKVNIFKYKMSFPIIIFILLSLAGVTFSTAKVYSLRMWANYAMPLVFYFLILENIKDFKEASNLLKLALIFFFVPSAVSGFWQAIFYIPPEYIDPSQILSIDPYPRFSGINPNANIFGLELSIFMMLTLYFFVNTRYRWLYIFMFISMVILLFNTYSRSAWAAFISAYSVQGLLKYRKAYITFVILAVFLLFFFPPTSVRFMSRVTEKDMMAPRVHTFDVGMDLFKERPIMGYGPGGYETSSIQGHKLGFYGVAGMDAHNEYVTFLVEGGLLFIGSYLFMMYRGFIFSVQIFKLPNKIGSNYGLFMMSIIVVILMVGIAGQSYRHAGFYLWTYIAIGEIYLRELGSVHPEGKTQ